MNNFESLEQQHVFKILELNETPIPKLKFVYAVPNGGHRLPAVAGKLKAEGLKAGVSDICLPFRSADGVYPGAYIEMKFGKGRVTKEQAAFLDFVKSEGYAITVAWLGSDALDWIEVYIGRKLRGRDGVGGSRAIPCGICGERCFSPADLTKHVAKKHL